LQIILNDENSVPGMMKTAFPAKGAPGGLAASNRKDGAFEPTKHPSIASDSSLGFPHHIVRVLRQQSHAYDLIVMRRVPGETLGSIIQEKWRQGQAGEVKRPTLPFSVTSAFPSVHWR